MTVATACSTALTAPVAPLTGATRPRGALMSTTASTSMRGVGAAPGPASHAGATKSTRGAPARAVSASNGQGPAPPPKKQSFSEIMGFSGYAPEVINGRLAQLGFVAGLGAEIATGESFTDQFATHWPSFLFASGVITLASFMPNFNSSTYTSNPSTKKEVVGPFSPGAEMFNSRAAMVGIAAMLVIEGLKGGPLIDLHSHRVAPAEQITAASIRQQVIQESEADGFEPRLATGLAATQAPVAPPAVSQAVPEFPPAAMEPSTTVLAVEDEVVTTNDEDQVSSVADELRRMNTEMSAMRSELAALRVQQ